MFRILFLQLFEHDIDGIFEVLVILTDLHGIQHLQKRIEVLFLLRRLIMDIPDQRCIKQCFRFRPEFITGLSLAFRVRDECGDQFQNVLFAMNIGERIVFHGLTEVDRIQHPDLIAILQKRAAAGEKDLAFRIRDHVAAVHLEKIGFQPESRLAGPGSADDKDILVSRILRILGPALHSKGFCLSQDHVLLKIRIDEWLDIFPCPPPGRSVLHSLPVLLGIHPFNLDDKDKYCRNGCTDHHIKRVKRRHEVPKCHRKSLHKGQDLF